MSDFSNALWWMKEGKRVARSGWNGKGMWIAIAKPLGLIEIEPIRWGSEGKEGAQYRLHYQPHIVMKAADHTMVPWLASVTDLMAEDWEVVDA